jgi:poly-gamma-glutamate synthesis protein (capsule biosynthesis protein)
MSAEMWRGHSCLPRPDSSGRFFRAFCLAILCAAGSLLAAGRDVVLLVGGDVTWAFGFKEKAVVLGDSDPADPDWRGLPSIVDASQPEAHTKSFDYKINYGSPDAALRYPLARVAPIFHAADLVFVNLETPLSDSAKWTGDYRTPAKFAEVMRAAGISAVTMANNHSYDCEAAGLVETIDHLNAVGIGHVGAGRNLADARRPWIVQKNGLKIGILGYAQFSNMGEIAFASPHQPGVAAMDPAIIREDIRKLRPQVDYVAVAFHWGTDKTSRVSPANRDFAHQVIDAGADMVFGGHTPHPKGIEIYHGKAIIYSPGHVIAGHQHIEWGDNYLVRFTLGPKAIAKLEVLPIAGFGEHLAQPYLLEGDPAQKLLSEIRDLSAKLDTKLEIQGNVGIIKPGD